MNCPQCGADTHPGQKFCARCGSPLAATTTAPASTVADAIPPLPIPAQLPVPYSQETPNPQTPITGPVYPQAAPPFIPTSIAPIRARSRNRVLLVIAAALTLLAIPAVVMALLLASKGPSNASSALLTPTAVPTTDAALSTTPQATSSVTAVVLDAEAEATLNRAAEAMRDVKTLSYSSEVGFFGVDSNRPDITDTQPLNLTLSGDVSLPDSFTLNSNIPQLGQYVTIAGDTWKRQSINDPWAPQDTSSSSLGIVNPLTFSSYLYYHEPGTVQLISTDTQRGKTLHRVRFAVDTRRMAADTDDSSTRQIFSTSRINVDIWVNDADSLLDHMTLSVDMESGAGVILRTTFSNYNGNVVIEPPQ
ncbi:MAG TPA: zinc ribbon domain-containing protein [Chloroflexia bacterium]|nr:zinc ribbon domain-containing protein [Chloroflexia bacterium]